MKKVKFSFSFFFSFQFFQFFSPEICNLFPLFHSFFFASKHGCTKTRHNQRQPQGAHGEGAPRVREDAAGGAGAPGEAEEDGRRRGCVEARGGEEAQGQGGEGQEKGEGGPGGKGGYRGAKHRVDR